MKVYYYVDKNRTRQGPILVNDLVMFDVGPNTLVWCKGMDKWKHAEEVEELAFLFVTDESMKESIMDDGIGTSQEDMAPCDEGTQTPEEYGFNMPLIQCPECENMISAKAQECPKCGYPVGQVENSSPTHFNNDGEDYYPEKPSSSKWLYAVIGALAAGIVAMLLVLLLRKEDTPNTATVAEWPVQETAAPETSSHVSAREEPSTAAPPASTVQKAPTPVAPPVVRNRVANGTYRLNGAIMHKQNYYIDMELNVKGNQVSGQYIVYNGENVFVRLSGTVDANGNMWLTEYKNGAATGYYFTGTFNKATYSGKYKCTNRKLTMNFSASTY